jgi:uncharacterized membrane protein
VVDAKGIRTVHTPLYAAASFIGVSLSTTIYSVARGRSAEMVVAMRSHWRRFVTMGIAAAVTYTLVQIAFQRAPVGYVTCLRESSVVIAAFIGTRFLGEGHAKRRVIAASVVLTGLLLLIVGR